MDLEAALLANKTLRMLHAKFGGKLDENYLSIGSCAIWYRMAECRIWLLFEGHPVYCGVYQSDIDDFWEDLFCRFIRNPEPWMVIPADGEEYFRSKMRSKETFRSSVSHYVYGLLIHRKLGRISDRWIKSWAKTHGFEWDEIKAMMARIKRNVLAVQELR